MIDDEQKLLDEQAFKREQEINTLRSKILSDGTLSVASKASKLEQVSKAYDEDTSSVDLRTDIPDNIKEMYREIYIANKKQEQQMLQEAYTEPARTHNVASTLRNGMLASEMEGLSNRDRAQVVKNANNASRMFNGDNAVNNNGMYTPETNNMWEYMGGFFTGIGRESVGFGAGLAKGVAEVSTSVQNTAASGLHAISLATEQNKINMLRDQAKTPEDVARVDAQQKELDIRKGAQLNLIEEDPLLAKMFNMGNKMYQGGKSLWNLSETNQRKAEITNAANNDYIKLRENEYIRQAKEGNSSYTKMDGTPDYDLISEVALLDLEEITKRTKDNGDVVDKDISEISDPTYGQLYNKHDLIINKDKYDSYVAVPELNFADNAIGQTWEGTIDGATDSFARLTQKRADNLANNESNIAGVFNNQRDRDNIRRFFSAITGGSYEGEFFQDLANVTVTPLRNPLDSLMNQVAQAPDMISQMNPLTIGSSMFAQDAVTLKDIQKMQDLGILSKDMSPQELAARQATANLGSAAGLIGDRALKNVIVDTGDAAKKLTGIGKTSKVSSNKAFVGKAAKHTADKYISAAANLTESEMKKSALSASGKEGDDEVTRSQVIWDSSMPSANVASPSIAVGKAIRDVATDKVMKGTEYAADRWSKVASSYQESKTWMKNKATNFKDLRESIFAAEDIVKPKDEAAPKTDNVDVEGQETTTTNETEGQVKREDISIREKLFEQMNNLKSSISEVKEKFEGTRKDFLQREGDKSDLKDDYYKEKKEANDFVTKSTLLADRATAAYESMVTKTKDLYNEIIKSPEPTDEKEKKKRDEDLEAMSDDIMMNFQNLSYTKAEVEAMANSPAVQNNPRVKENFDFIMSLYNSDHVTIDEKSGLVAPFSPEHVPNSNQDRTTKEFFYGGGQQSWSRGILNYVKDMRDAANKGDTEDVQRLTALASKWRDHQLSRINSGKLYGKILDRAKNEVGLIERTVKYGERQSERATRIQEHLKNKKDNVPTENPVDAEIQSTIHQNLNPIDQNQRAAPKDSTLPAEGNVTPTEKTVEPKQEQQATKELDTRSPTEVITKEEVKAKEAKNEQVYKDIGKTTAKTPVAKPKGNKDSATALKEAKEVVENSKDSRISRVPKDFSPNEITHASVTQRVLDKIDKYLDSPNMFLRYAEKNSASRDALPTYLIAANETRDSNDPRFQDLKTFVNDLNDQAKLFTPELAELTGKLVKQIEAIEKLQNLLAEAKGKDATAIKGYINTAYKSTARTNSMISRFGGVKNIGLFAKYVIEQHFQDNKEGLLERVNLTNASPLKVIDGVNKANNGKSFRITDYARDKATHAFEFGKGVFNFAIGRHGAIESNKDNWSDGSEESKNRFVNDVVRRLRNTTKTMTPEREKEINNAVGQLYDMIIKDLDNDGLKTNVEKNTQYVGVTNEYGMSPLNLVSYALNGRNVLDDSIKASIIVASLQVMKEQSEDLIDRSPLSVAKLLGLENSDDIDRSEYTAFRGIGLPSNLLYSKLQAVFMPMFDTNGLDNEKTPEYLRERLATHAAVMAVNYLMDKGILIKKKYTKEQLNAHIVHGDHFTADELTFFAIDKEIEEDDFGASHTYYASHVADALNPWELFYDLGYAVTGEENTSTSAEPSAVNDRVRVIPQTDTYTQALFEGTKKHANETIYSVVPYFSNVIKDKDAMIEILDYDEDLEAKYPQRELIESAKSGRENELKTLEKNINFLNKNPSFMKGFKHSMSIFSNARTAITSTTLNPMSDKVSRGFLALNTYAKERTKDYFDQNKEVEKMFLYALAIRLGAKESSKKSRFDQAMETINDTEIPVEIKNAVSKMREGTATKDDLITIKNWGNNFVVEKDNNLNTINAVYEWVNYRALQDGSLDKYTSYATVDNDAKNSGVAITRALFGELVDGNINLDQVGIYINGKFQSFAEYSQQDGNVDAYQFAIRKGIESAREKQNNPEGMSKEDITQNDKQLRAFDLLGQALGVELLGKDGSVSGILREIAKPLLMTAYYEAKSKSLAKAARKEIMSVILKHMNKIIVNKDQEALDRFNKTFNQTFKFESLARSREESERMNSFLTRLENHIANPIAWMAVDGIMDLTSSTAEDRNNLTQANQSFFSNLASLSNTIMLRLREKNKGIATEAQRRNVDKFVKKGVMRLATALGDHETNDFGLAIQETKRASISDLVGNELPNTPEFRNLTYGEIDRMDRGKRRTELLDKIKKHNAKRSQSMVRQFQIKDGNLENYAIPEVRTFGDIGVGSLALNAHATDSAMINDIYMNGTESVLGVYDQVTTTPEGIIEASQIENQAFKEYTMNRSATEDFASAMVTAIHNITVEYENNPLIKELVSPEEFNNFINSQNNQLKIMLGVDKNVSERRKQLFGEGKEITIDNYPLGGIDSKVRSPSDSAPVVLSQPVKRFQLAQRTLEVHKSFLENNNELGRFDREIKATEKNLSGVKDKLELAKKAEATAATIVKSAETIDAGRLQDWAKDHKDSIIATEESLASTLGTLMKLDGNLSPEMVDNYSAVLTELINPLIASNQGLNPTRNQLAIKVNKEMKDQASFGYFSPKDNEVVISASPLKGDQTNSEVFLHELVHGVLYHAINASKELRDSMWDIYVDVKQKAIEEGWDKEDHENFAIYDYVFNNPNNSGNTPTGLHEFGAYALTNPKFIELAKNTDSKENVYANFDLPLATGGFFNRILSTVGNWIKALFIPKVKAVDSNAHSAMTSIVKHLDQTNRQVIESIKLDRNKKIRSTRDAVSVLNKFSERVSERVLAEVKGKVDSILNKAKEAPTPKNKNNVTAFRTIMSLKNLTDQDRIKLINDLNLGREPHDAINEAYTINAKHTFTSSESTLQMAASTLMGSFNKSLEVKGLILKSIKKRQQDADLARSTIKDRLDDYLKTVDKIEDTAMTAGILETTAYRLLDLLGADQMMDFIVNHDSQRQLMIDRARLDLENSLPSEQVTSMLNQLDGLANEISGEGDLAPAQMKNVDNIIEGKYAPESRLSFFTENAEQLQALKPQMEAYVAMKAYNQSAGFIKQSVEGVFKKHRNYDGTMSPVLQDAIQVMQDVRTDSLHREFGSNPTMMSAKYSSKMGDPNIMHHFVPRKDAKKYLDDGWKMVTKVKSMSDAAGHDVVMLERRVPSDLGFNSHALHSTNQKNPFMTTVTMYQRMYGSDAGYISKREIDSAVDEMKVAAWNGTMASNPLNLTPILNAQGEVTGFNHSYSINRIPLEMQKDRRFSEVIADEYAQTAGNFTAREVSKDLIKALKDDFEQNAHLAPNDFIQISSEKILDNGEVNPFYQSYQRLTPEVKQAAFDAFGKDVIYVRKGMARAVVGTAKFDLSNNAVTKYLDTYVGKHFTNKKDVAMYNKLIGHSWNAVQPYLVHVDRGWREVVSLSKSAIAVMNPVVFGLNFMSNAVMLMVNGVTPIQLVKYTKEAFTELRKYENRSKEMNNLQLKLESYKGSPNGRRALEAKILSLQNQIDSSLTKELIDNGMLQSIQTEIKYNEYGILNRTGNKVKDKLNSINPKLGLGDSSSRIFKEVFMVGDATTATLMSYANQIMDYTSRYTYMKALTENGMKIHSSRRPSRETLIREAQDLFVNYDLPDGKGIEALNELGLVWFSKYYMGIQHVVMNMFKTRRFNSALYLYGISSLVSSESIYKNFFLVDSPTKLFRTPMDAIETLSVPPLIKAFF